MTNLLDLPPELFQQIIHEVVKAGFVRSWPAKQTWALRGVCRVFAAEIQNDILTKHDSEFMGEYYTRGLTKRLLGRYLVGLFRSSQDVNQAFLLRLKNMGEHIVAELDITDSHQKIDHIDRLCTGLKKITQYPNITHGLWCSRRDSCWRKCLSWDRHDTPIQDKICAAITVGAHDLLEKLLPEFEGFQMYGLYELEPLIMALDMDDKVSLDIILQFLRNLLATNKDLALKHMATREDAVFFIGVAIIYGIQLHRISSVEALLELYQKHLPRPPTSAYSVWIESALEAWHQGKYMLTSVLKFRSGPKSMISRQAIILACAQGNCTSIEKVLNEVEDIDEGSILMLPIFIAVRSYRPIAIEAAVKAGADIEIQAPSNTARTYTQPVTPMELAMHRQAARIVEALIDAGATIPHMSTWSTHKETFRVLHTNASKKAKVPLPTWTEFRKLTMDQRQALVY